MSSSESQQNIDITTHLSTGKNPRGIPTVVFIDDVETFLKKIGGVPVETAIGAFNELYQKYKFLESSLLLKKEHTKGKLPEIDKTLELVRMLKEKQENSEEMITHYSVTDTIYAKAQVDCTGKVCLWLGGLANGPPDCRSAIIDILGLYYSHHANVMLEYSYDEAIEVLESNRASALEKMQVVTEDLDHLRDQAITSEVNIARLFNYNVVKRKQKATFTEKTSET